MTTNDQTWIEIMPATPLARGVPVVSFDGKTRTIVTASEPLTLDGSVTKVAAAWWRVDLDDPQGFGCALRGAVQSAVVFAEEDLNVNIVIRYMRGETTDADRIALAKALAEVMS